ncbi:Ig-like domain-containing protein [Candidatus Uhrbacteria bacterium]|nr:Ig-like domain-containing protein [Candidatus Uhrbacteria bacterium]
MTDNSRTYLRSFAVYAAGFGVLCVFVFFGLAHPVFAQTDFLQTSAEASGLPQTNIILIIARLIRAFLGILGIIFVLLVLYAGFLYMTSQGEAGKTEKAKKIITQATIGVLIIFSSYAIALFVINAILGATSGQIVSKAVIEKYKEPLAGALGAGIVESHYPPRNAVEIPRNTKIFVTFKEAVDPKSIISGESGLNNTNVYIFETAKGKDKKLGTDAVKVVTNEQNTIYVFDPVDLLGNPTSDTNYTVALQPGIKKANGSNAFVGAYSSGYGWTFEVSTEIDLTPPKVVSVIPNNSSEEPRNVTVEMTFNEAMDPVSSTGSYIDEKNPLFTNIAITQKDVAGNVQGTYEISNGYKTVGFTSTDACSKDPCGDVIYCLPATADLSVTGKAATLDNSNPPQAQLIGVSYDGLTDASGNSLDGNGDGKACGSEKDLAVCANNALNDNYSWSFNTTDAINDTVPKIVSLKPEIGGQEIDQNAPLEIAFSTLLKGSTVNSSNVSVWPDPLYSMWFSSNKEDNVDAKTTKVLIGHPAFISNAEGGYDYYPVVTNGLKSAYQICMYPSMQVGGACDGTNSSKPYCCNGSPSAVACKTLYEPGTLPGNVK